MSYVGLVIALLVNISLALVDKRSSRKLADSAQVMNFSFLKTLLCAILALIILPFGNFNMNVQGIIISVLAGVFHSLSVVLIMYSLKRNDAVYVNLFMSAGVIIPSVFGWLIWNETISVAKVFCLLLLIAALALVLDIRKNSKVNLKLLLCMFICYGMLMVMQGMFPKYCEQGSKTLFSVIMYGTSAIIFRYSCKNQGEHKINFAKPLKGLCMTAAVLNLVINLLLTSLSVNLDAVVVFPVVHGMKLVVLTLFSSALWKEKLTAIQITGALIAILCICLLSI